ncbi:FUR1 [Candida oxycetoniae]|uniref:uracil phosphoribosyltransferase n=1 Tax=Candida oxycetoniae TaxID=497107 RepID=A0AAI9SUS9_9ASCO|nr:FUR1 [Candida oxycetoniae]KAI3403317.2 FUR1 [Candida oxycetoniae]
MIRSSIRRLHNVSRGSETIPYVPVPKNKYNIKRSAFNFKPQAQPGLIYNPPAAIINPSMQTPYIFLPQNDPRRELAKANRIPDEIIADMPIIRQFKAPNEREYSISRETVEEMKKLAAQDPERWDLKALSKKFNIEMRKLIYFFRTEHQRAKKLQNLQESGKLPKHILDRQKRRQIKSGQKSQQQPQSHQYRKKGGQQHNNDRPRSEGPKREAILDLNKYKGQEIRVRCVGGRQITGYLKGFDQLMNLVLEDVVEQLREGLNQLPVEDTIIECHGGHTYKGYRFLGKICGVSIVRAGESMEMGLRDCCRSVKIGKILIQRDEETALPKLFYEKLPRDISDRYVFLLDPMLATGGSAMMAIEVLLARGVRMDRIFFLNLLAAPEGIRAFRSKYPDVKIITGGIDERLDEDKYIVPGLGDFGDRYYCI